MILKEFSESPTAWAPHSNNKSFYIKDFGTEEVPR